MTQQAPSFQTFEPAEESDTEAVSNIRRRLGNWTSSPVASTELVTAPFASGEKAGNLQAPAEPAQSVDTVELMSGQTARSDEMMTVNLQQAVPLHVTAPMQEPHTQPFQVMNPAIRARLDEQAARSVSYHTAELQAEVADAAQSSNPTVPFEGTSQTAPMAAAGGMTAPMAAQTMPMAGATAPIDSVTAPMAWQTSSIQGQTGEIAGQTMPIQGQPTAGLEGVTAPMAANASTASFGVTYTGIMGDDSSPAATAPMSVDPNSTVPLPGARPDVSDATRAEIEALRARIAADPDDTDTVQELALALNEVGERAEAHQILVNLAQLFETQGDHAQAQRIRTMLGEAHTAPIPADSGATQPMPRQTTDSLKPRTGTLSLRSVPASRDGRIAQRQKTDDRERTVFPARDVSFTEHLPQLDRLSGPAMEFFSAAEVDREAGKHRSALDHLQMAVAHDASVPAVFLRMAEIQLKLGYRRKALETIEELQQFESLFRSGIPDWCFSRLRLHAEPFDLAKVQRLVDTMIEDGHAPIAAPYVARLIEHLVLGDRIPEASEYADRICGLAPGDTRSTLEAAILAIKMNDRGRAIDRWEFALRNGADPVVGKASMAALVADSNEADHWRLMADVLPAYRASRDQLLADAYRRTAEAAGWSAIHKAAASLFLPPKPGASDRTALAAAAGDRTGSPAGRAAAAAALVHILQSGERTDEYLASIRTTINLFTDERLPDKVNWSALLGFTPTVDEMSYELGQELMKAGDAAGAVDVLKQGYALNESHTKLTQALAEAFAKTSQLGSAVTILDKLAMAHRKAGRLEEMAAVLRQMSQLAPSNIKVKSRLVDAYLQRGFVAEARAELIQRADLEERAGQVKEAVVSLQRAADLSWSLGFPQESFNLYDRILALDPEDVANRSALVNLYLQVGRLSDAAEHQRAIVDLALKHGRKHEAIAALHQVIGLTPDDMTAYYQLAELLASMGEFQQAEKVYRRIVLMNPDDAIAQAKATSMAALKEQQAKN